MIQNPNTLLKVFKLNGEEYGITKTTKILFKIQIGNKSQQRRKSVSIDYERIQIVEYSIRK